MDFCTGSALTDNPAAIPLGTLQFVRMRGDPSDRRTTNMRIEGIFAIFLMAACIFPAAADVQEQSASDHGTLIGMANPSAVWAEQMGYQYLIRTNPDGSQFGVCILPDGSEHDAWELFRQSQSRVPEEPLIGLPDPSAVWAERMGYQYLIRTNPDGSQFGVCILRDRSEHDAWELFREYTGISRPGGISFIHPAPSMGSISSKVTGGQSYLGASPAALKP